MVQFAESSLSPTAGSADSGHLSIPQLVAQQRCWFATGKTKDVEFRIAQLQALKQAILTHQADILAALQADLGKAAFEGFLTEISSVKEIDYAIKHLRRWVKPKRVSVSLEQLPARASLYPEPLGVVLIIAPWNYPFQLMILPLVAAIAAGNCALLKPSEVAPHSSRVMANLIRATFDPGYVALVEGGVEVSQALLQEKFDHIFFTGGTAIGKIVMAAAAQHLTPVTLELGGKSPCIVDVDVNLDYTAKRIVWGKYLNAGQTCIAPDYLLVDRRIHAPLLSAMQTAIHQLYGDDPAHSPDYGRIISDRHFQRLSRFLDKGQWVTGGQTNAADRYIAPTILDGITWDDPVMQDEIFGPILPVLTYDEVSEAIAQINQRPKPLALYLFSRDRTLQHRILRETSSGGVCLNDTLMHAASTELPFGGVGDSGMGSYHGKSGFDTFSHYKSVLAQPFWFDLPVRYAPYAGKLQWVKRLRGID